MYETKKLISRKRGRYLIDNDLSIWINNLSKEFHIDDYKLHKKCTKLTNIIVHYMT